MSPAGLLPAITRLSRWLFASAWVPWVGSNVPRQTGAWPGDHGGSVGSALGASGLGASVVLGASVLVGGSVLVGSVPVGSVLVGSVLVGSVLVGSGLGASVVLVGSVLVGSVLVGSVVVTTTGGSSRDSPGDSVTTLVGLGEEVPSGWICTSGRG
jgi:hypothetical protein